MKFTIKRDDRVKVMTGKDRGKIGKVLKVDPEKGRVIVERANMIKRHTRPTQTAKGGILEKEAPLSLSNVMLICPACNKPARTGRREAGGRSVRYCKKCGELVDQ